MSSDCTRPNSRPGARPASGRRIQIIMICCCPAERRAEDVLTCQVWTGRGHYRQGGGFCVGLDRYAVAVRAPIVNVDAVPATTERWDDVVVTFGRRGDDPDWCWCQRFIGRPGVDASTNNRDSLRNEITTAVVPPGVLAYIDGVPVGWSRVMPRAEVPWCSAQPCASPDPRGSTECLVGCLFRR